MLTISRTAVLTIALVMMSLPTLAYGQADELARLKAENAMLKAQLARQELELAELRQQVDRLSAPTPQASAMPAKPAQSEQPKPLTMTDVLSAARRYNAAVPGESSAATSARQQAAIQGVQGRMATIRGTLVDVQKDGGGLKAIIRYESPQQAEIRPARRGHNTFYAEAVMGPAERMIVMAAVGEIPPQRLGATVSVELQVDSLRVMTEGSSKALRVELTGSNATIR